MSCLTYKRLAAIRWCAENRAENNIGDEDVADLLAEVDRLRARHAALRADVEKQGHDHARGLWPDFKGILARDDERGQS